MIICYYVAKALEYPRLFATRSLPCHGCFNFNLLQAGQKVHYQLPFIHRSGFPWRQFLPRTKCACQVQHVGGHRRRRRLHQGPFIKDVHKIFWVFDPLPPCPHFGQIYSSEITQPPLPYLLMGQTPPPFVRTSFMDCPSAQAPPAHKAQHVVHRAFYPIHPWATQICCLTLA